MDKKHVIITARMGEGNILSLCVSSHLDGGGGGGVYLPSQAGVGTPFPGLDGGVTLFPDRGVPTFLGWGGGYPYRNSIACTCYTAGGMPLAFTQEDFLVFIVSGGYHDGSSLWGWEMRPAECELMIGVNKCLSSFQKR